MRKESDGWADGRTHKRERVRGLFARQGFDRTVLVFLELLMFVDNDPVDVLTSQQSKSGKHGD